MVLIVITPLYDTFKGIKDLDFIDPFWMTPSGKFRRVKDISAKRNCFVVIRLYLR